MKEISKMRIGADTFAFKDEKARQNKSVFNVEFSKDHFGNITSDYNDNDINNARNNGQVVQAKYFDDSTNQTFTYYYSTMESNRKPTFIRTYIEDNKTIQVLASVNFDKKVSVVKKEINVQPQFDALNQEVDQLTGEVSDTKQAIGLLQTTDEQIKSQITGLHDSKEDKMEVVTNENGTAIKYANGQMICYNTISRDISCTNAWGVLFSGTLSEKILFANAFIEPPTLCVSLNPSSSTGFLIGFEDTYPINNDGFSGVSVLRPNSRDSIPVTINFIAIGKWK